MQDDGCDVMHKASTGYIPPCREGEKWNLKGSETRGLLCHLRLQWYNQTPARTRGSWKSHNLVPIHTAWSLSRIYLVQEYYWWLLAQKHVIQSAAAFDSTRPQYHVSPCNSRGSLFPTSQEFWSIIFSYLLQATQHIELRETCCMLKFRPTVSQPDQSKTAWDWEIQYAVRDLTHKSMISLAQLLFCNIRLDINKESLLAPQKSIMWLS